MTQPTSTTRDLEHEVRHLRDDVTELVLWLGDQHAQELLAEIASEVNPVLLRLVSRVRWLSDEVETVRSSISELHSA